MSVVSAAPRRSLFRQPDFAKLWSAATLSLFGTQISQIAIPVIAVLLLQASPGEVGLLTTIEFLPFLLFTLPAGVWVDRLRRRPILIAADIGRAVLLASIPIAFATGALTMLQLYVVGFLTGVMTVFFDIADQSYLPTVLERDQLVDGNAKLQMSHSSAQILGQPVGGGIVALFSAPVAIIIDAVSYIGSALLIFGIRREETAAPGSSTAAARSAAEVSDSSMAGTSVEAEAAAADPAVNPTGAAAGTSATPGPAGGATSATSAPARRASMRQDITDGLRYIGGHRYLRNIAACTATANLFSNVAFAIFAVYAYRNLELTPAGVGALGGFGGAGVLLGALIASKVADRFGIGRAIVWSSFLTGVAALGVPAAPKEFALPVLAVVFFLTSIGNVVYNVNQVSLRQAITPERFLGRMNATMRFLVWGTIPIGSLLGAGLSEIDAIGVHTTIWIGALLGLTAFLPVYFSPVRTLQRIPDPEEAAA